MGAVRVLMLTQRLPYAPNRGDRLRAYHHISHLLAAGWQVDLLALVHDEEEAGQAQTMRQPGLTVATAAVPRWLNHVHAVLALPTTRPVTLALLDSPQIGDALQRLLRQGRPDVVMPCSSSMAAFALRRELRDVPMVLDMVDVDSEKWRALSTTSSWPMSWIYLREHRTLRAFEAEVTRRARTTLVVTPRERDALAAIAPDARIEVVSLGIDVVALQRPAGPPPSPPRVVFTGVMNYAPNVDAALWLARSIWPLVRARRPDVCLDIVGASPTAAVRALQDPESGVRVTGSVPDVKPYLWAASVSVAPLRVARGVQTKVLEASAAGLPCVVTPEVSAGLPASLRPLCPVAASPAEFAEAVIDLLARPPEPDRLADGISGLAWDRVLAPLSGILEEAAASAGHPA
jgi:sugar transferase (PEP-CTERM/EpsH1 system associated)